MKIDKNDFFRQVTKRVCSHLDIEKAMHSCMEYLAPLLPARSIYLELFEPDFGVIRIIAMAAVSGGRKMNMLVPLPQIDRTLVEEYEKQRPKLEIVNDPEKALVSKTMTQMLKI